MENEMIEDGLYCDGGSKWMSIGSEGNVYICNTFIYQNEYSIGNLFTDDIILGSKFRRCPIQSCDQICDRHWSKKRVYKDGVIIDEQDVADPNYYNLFENTTSILFAPTWKCNYSCSYCGLPRKELYPDIFVIFWVNWGKQSKYGVDVEKKNGVWIFSLDELGEQIKNAPLHTYQKRVKDKKGNAKNSYLIKLLDSNQVD